jgi:GntR family transcriptional regulator
MAQLMGRAPSSIDRDSDVPYYLQLRAILENFIDRNHLKPGSPLPSEAELSRTYRLSRTAIRNALTQLELAGRIRRTRGRRPVVARRIPWDFQLEYNTGYRDYVQPYRIRALLSNRISKAGAEPARMLGLSPSQPIFEVMAVYDGKVPTTSAAAIVRMWIATDATESVARLARSGKVPDFEVGGHSLVMQLMDRYGVDLAYSVTTATPAASSAEEARLLGLRRGSVVLHVESVNHDRLGRPVIAVRATPHTEDSRLSFIVRY